MAPPGCHPSTATRFTQSRASDGTDIGTCLPCSMPLAREALHRGSWIREDPFHEHGLANFRIIELRASQRADDIAERIAGE